MSLRMRIGLVVAVIAVVAGIVAAVTLQAGRSPLSLGGADMPGWQLVDESQGSWLTVGGKSGAWQQKWVGATRDVTLHIVGAEFDSAEAAYEACAYQAGVTAMPSDAGPFSAVELGDAAWHWGTSPTGGRLVVCRGRWAVSLHLVGDAVGLEAELERIAGVLLTHLGD